MNVTKDYRIGKFFSGESGEYFEAGLVPTSDMVFGGQLIKVVRWSCLRTRRWPQ